MVICLLLPFRKGSSEDRLYFSKDLYCVNGHGRSGGQTAGGHPKASPRPRQPPFPAPAVRELESACSVSMFSDASRYLRSAFRGLRGRGQQQFATQTLRVHLLGTVGTKIIADPEKYFQELISEKLLIFFAGWALLGINYRFQ